MPSTVNDLLTSAALIHSGTVAWGEAPPLTAPGVYVVARDADADSRSGATAVAPLSPERISELLDGRSELTLDGGRPTATELAERLTTFWLPDETVLYVGLASASVAGRVGAYYRTRLGARSPHAGGWFIKTLEDLSALHVHYAAAADPRAAEVAMLDAFCAAVSDESRLALTDVKRPLPFANLDWPGHGAKRHGIRGATGTSEAPDTASTGTPVAGSSAASPRSDDPAFWLAWVEAGARDPCAWLESADALKRAADLLASTYQAEMQQAFLHGPPDPARARSRLGPVYLMLAGFAVENLAKGIIVTRTPTEPPPSTHLDALLVSRAGITLVDGEPELVRRLGLFLTALGRYPVPLPKDAPKLVFETILAAPTRVSTNDPLLVDALYKRMRETLVAGIGGAH